MGISEIALTGGLVLLGISVLLILIFGMKNIVTGKHEFSKIAVVVTPFVIFGITYGVTGQMTESGLITLLILMGLMVLLVLFSGIRGSFKF